MRKMNLGCGSIQPEGWDNADNIDYGQPILLNINAPFFRQTNAIGEVLFESRPGPYDLIVANHLLSCFSHHDLLRMVLPNIRDMLAPGGTFRILVPDVDKAIQAYLEDNYEWFPLGGDLPGIDERLCTYLPWFGESKSIFTFPYLKTLLLQSGFGRVRRMECGQSFVEGGGSLDDRCHMSLIVEAVNPLAAIPAQR